MYAIIDNGNKQYKVAVGDIVKLEKLNANEGDTVTLNVVMVSDENGINMPSFFGYIGWSALFLLPVFLLDSLLFFLI